MINFYDGQLTDLLRASPFRDNLKVQALSLALRDGFRKLCDYTDHAYIYAAIDSMEAEALDLLATEIKAQFYDPDYSIDIKRDVLKNANRWHQIAGTKAAVEELAKSIFGECQVLEWFEYDGQPYHFEIITSAMADPENIAEFNEILRNVKNARSYLDAVAIHRTITTGGSHSVAIVTQATIAQPAIHCKL